MNPVLAVALVVAILGVVRPTKKVRGPHHNLLTAERRIGKLKAKPINTVNRATSII